MPIFLVGDISSDGEVSAKGVQFSVKNKGMSLYSTATAGLTIAGKPAKYKSQPSLARTVLILGSKKHERVLVDFSVDTIHSIKVTYSINGASPVKVVCQLTVTTAPPVGQAPPPGWTMKEDGSGKLLRASTIGAAPVPVETRPSSTSLVGGKRRRSPAPSFQLAPRRGSV
jgi:hypothetical protein